MMVTKEQISEPPSTPPWYVYILHCRDRSYYTGITTDLARRLAEHNSARGGARYTRPRRPVELVYFEPAVSRSKATSRENQIKKLTAQAKKQLVNSVQFHEPSG